METLMNLIYEALQYVNLVLAALTAGYLFIGQRRSPPPWKNIKRALCLNMVIMVAIYIQLIINDYVEPLWVRGNTTLLILSLLVLAYFGAKRHGPEPKRDIDTNP